LHKKIAIVASLKRELHPLVKRWPSHKVEHENRQFTFYEGEHAMVVCGGIGAERARRAAEAIIMMVSPELVISAGIAGALVPELQVGDTIFPSTVIDTRDGSRHPTHIDQAPVGTTTLGRTVLASHSKIVGAAEKQWLAKSYLAHAVDMESAAVAVAAELHHLPFVAIKSISDEFDFALPELSRFVERGDFKTVRFLFHVAFRPWLWLKVLRLAENTQIAARNLCAWLRPSALTHTIVPSTLERRS
jgi:adenosylhomocysteine nucleosidase